MKKIISMILILILILSLVGCSSENEMAEEATAEEMITEEEPVAEEEQVTEEEPVAEEEPMAEELEITIEELEKYNGEDGMPAYVAIDGIIYDVTDVKPWKGGSHKGHKSGMDITDKINDISPHGASVIKNLTAVGKLAK